MKLKPTFKLIKVSEKTHRALKVASARQGLGIGKLLDRMSKDPTCLTAE